MREVGLDVCEGMELCFPLELSKGFQASSLVDLGPGALFGLATDASELPSCCEWILRWHSNWWKEIRPDLKWMAKYVAFEL